MLIRLLFLVDQHLECNKYLIEIILWKRWKRIPAIFTGTEKNRHRRVSFFSLLFAADENIIHFLTKWHHSSISHKSIVLERLEDSPARHARNNLMFENKHLQIRNYHNQTNFDFNDSIQHRENIGNFP